MNMFPAAIIAALAVWIFYLIARAVGWWDGEDDG